MLISTRGRYAVRVLIDLAENRETNYIPMREVAERQEISLKYLERIMKSLVQAGLVEGVQGKGGGYRLVKEPEDYKIGDIIRQTEGDIAPVSCLKQDASPCSRSEICKTLPMWKELNSVINTYLDNKTLADLLEDQSKENNLNNS